MRTAAVQSAVIVADGSRLEPESAKPGQLNGRETAGEHRGALKIRAGKLPALFAGSETSAKRFVEYFTAHIRNRNTRQAYFLNVSRFSEWCEAHGLTLERVGPVHVAAYVEELGRTHSKPTVKQHLAAIRMLFDWLVVGQVIPVNPAHSVRGPKHSVKKGKTSVLSPEEMRTLLDSIHATTLIGLRDRALIALMGYTFAAHGLHVREDWRRSHNEGRRLLHPETPPLGEAPRKRWEGERAPLPSQSGEISR
jgi:integrase